MMDIAGDRAFTEALLDKMLAHALRNVELYLDAVGDYIQIIQMGGDMGTQNGPQIRPRTYYEVFQPREKALWGRIHQLKPDVAVFLHCCGGIYDLIPGIIDAGCDILNPVQISARGMDPAAPEARVWRPDLLLGRRLRHADRAALWHARRSLRSTPGATSISSRPAAGLSLPRCITFRPEPRSKTSLLWFRPCMTAGQNRPHAAKIHNRCNLMVYSIVQVG
jgi:hypothetical protein